MRALLDARGVALGRRLNATDLQIDAGAMVAVIGPNGGGKTSLLRALAGIEGTGSVRIGGEDMAALAFARRRRLLSFLPASREILWPIRARDVVRLGADQAEDARVDPLLALLELEKLAERPVSQLSTGERARVLLARALLAEPRLLLLDEPLSNLDPYWVLRILEIVRQAAADGAAALISLHDIERVAAFDRVLLVDAGRIKADMPPAKMLASEELAEAFRVERSQGKWRLRPREGRQSSL